MPLLVPSSREQRYLGAHGGRGSGKSHFFAELATLRMYQETTRIVAVREVQSSIRDSVRQLMIDKIDKMGLTNYFDVTTNEIRTKTNNSLMIFRGMMDFNSSNIKSLEGYDAAWIEEAQDLSHHSLRLLRPTIRKPGSQIWAGWNPRHPSDAIERLLRPEVGEPPKKARIIQVNYGDNPFFPKTLKEEMELDRQNSPEMARHVWDGEYEILTEGSYYGKQLAAYSKQQNIHVPYDPTLETFAAWDLGIGDQTAIWVFQRTGLEWHWLYFYQARNENLEHYVQKLNQLPYKIDTHILPPDGAARELSSGKSRQQHLQKLGLKVNVLPVKERASVEDGINAVRTILPASYFDIKTRVGLDSLRAYRSVFDKKLEVLSLKALHDWASDGADAFRYAVLGGILYSRIGRSSWGVPVSREGSY